MQCVLYFKKSLVQIYKLESVCSKTDPLYKGVFHRYCFVQFKISQVKNDIESHTETEIKTT